MSGLIILPILIMYILFAIFMYKITTSKIVLIVILLFPFWDLIVQKGIKTYYQVFESEPIIYALPEFDKDGKIESLGLGDIYYTSFGYFTTTEKFENFKKSEKELYQKVNQYAELTAYMHGNNTKAIRVYMADDTPKRYEFIKKQKARYQVIASKPISYLFGFYKKRIYKLIDTKKNNRVLAESYAISSTVNKMRDFRRNVLWWQGGTGGSMIYVSGTSTLNLMFEKVLNMKLSNTNLNIYYKGWENE